MLFHRWVQTTDRATVAYLINITLTELGLLIALNTNMVLVEIAAIYRYLRNLPTTTITKVVLLDLQESLREF